MLPSPPGGKRRPPRPLGLRRSSSRDESRFLRRAGCGSSTHLAARQRSGSGSAGSGGGGGGGSSMAASGVTAETGGGTRSAAASLIRAWSPAWPWRALSSELQPARGTGVLKCRSDSAPPPPLTRRRGRSRCGHLGNGDRPAPGYGARRGTSLRGRRRRAAERGRPAREGRRERPRRPRRGRPRPGDTAGAAICPGGLGSGHRRLVSLAGSVRRAGRPCSRVVSDGRAPGTPAGAARPRLGGD